MRSRSRTEYENGLTPPHDPSLDLSFPRTRESRFVPHRISLDPRFRGYDVIQVVSANRTGIYIQRNSLLCRRDERDAARTLTLIGRSAA